MNPFYKFFIRFDNLSLLLMLGFSFLLIPVTLFFDTGLAFQRIVASVFYYSGIALLFKNGGFIRSNYLRFLSISIGVLIIAALLKILHIPISNTFLILGFSSMLVVYIVWFINRPERKIIDILKVLWLASFLGGMLFRILHYPYVELLMYIDLGLFILILVLFITSNFKKLIKS